MEALEIIDLIRKSEKKTPVRVTVQEKLPCEFEGVEVFSGGCGLKILFGDWKTLEPQLSAQAERISALHIENNACNSAIPMLDLKGLPARIEPGAILRDGVEVRKNAVVMMGAILNIGAVVGEGSMIDMGAVLGGRATVGKNCHIGAGAVLAGVIEPPSATPVTVGDGVGRRECGGSGGRAHRRGRGRGRGRGCDAGRSGECGRGRRTGTHHQIPRRENQRQDRPRRGPARAVSKSSRSRPP